MIRLALALALVAMGSIAALAQGVGGLPALAERDVAGTNVLDDGGFEERTADGTPAKWTLGASSAVWALDGTAHGGAASLRLSGVAVGQAVPAAEQTVTLPPGFYTLEGWVRTEGIGATRKRSGVRICLDGRPKRNWWKCTGLVRGTTAWRRLRQPLIVVRQPGSYRVSVQAYGLPDGVAWFDDVGLLAQGRPPLDAFLLYPNFRGMLFDDREQAVRLATTVDERALPGAGGSRLRVSLLDEAGGARVGREYPAAAGRLVAELDAARLAPGAYTLRAELVGAGGEVLARAADHRVVKTPAKARERFTVWYDERNVTHLEGRPTFVLGLYHTTGYSESPQTYARGHDGWGNARIAEAPINMLINYWLGVAPVTALRAYMDDLHDRGIYYLQTVNFYYADDPQYPKIPYRAARQGEIALNRWVAGTLSAHRGLAGFYTADERPADMVPKVFRQHRALAEAAPGTVTYAVLGNGWEEQAPLWRDAADVLGLDPYPITKARGQNHLALVGEWTRLGQEAVQGSRPLWMVLQFFPLTGAGGWPTQEELRAMSWMAIVEGAQGLFYWSFGARGLGWVKDTAQRERHWRDLVRVTREIKALEPVLLAPTVSVVTAESSGGAVRTLGKRAPDGARYLFAYNTRNAAARVTWTLAEPAREVTDLDDGRAVATEDGRLVAELAAYGIRRFRLR
ncbi:MAG: hypothetical protein ACREM3_20740 [Candidatus Rokuibacteriota bacterium]